MEEIKLSLVYKHKHNLFELKSRVNINIFTFVYKILYLKLLDVLKTELNVNYAAGNYKTRWFCKSQKKIYICWLFVKLFYFKEVLFSQVAW